MTVEEVNEKFASCPVFFESYYKFSFVFRYVTSDGYEIRVGSGGDSDDIYRLSVKSGVGYPFYSAGEWKWVTVTKDGETVFEVFNRD